MVGTDDSWCMQVADWEEYHAMHSSHITSLSSIFGLCQLLCEEKRREGGQGTIGGCCRSHLIDYISTLPRSTSTSPHYGPTQTVSQSDLGEEEEVTCAHWRTAWLADGQVLRPLSDALRSPRNDGVTEIYSLQCSLTTSTLPIHSLPPWTPFPF